MQSAEEMLRRFSDSDPKVPLHVKSDNVNVQEVHDTTQKIVAGQVDKHHNCEQKPVKLDDRINAATTSKEPNLRTKQHYHHHQQQKQQQDQQPRNQQNKQQYLASSSSNQKANERIKIMIK